MIGIIGYGSVGSMLAYFLNKAGHIPYVLTKGREHCTVEFNGNKHQVKVKVVNYLPGNVKYTLVAVKAYDTASIISKIKGIPVVFQNGIGGLELVKANLGLGYSAVVTYGAYRNGDSTLVVKGNVIMPKELHELANLLTEGGMVIRLVNNVEPYRWLKAMVNSAINPITAILKTKVGAVIDNAQARWIADSIINECIRVTDAMGITMPTDPHEELIRVAESAREHYSSMYQDIINHKPTEVDYLNGVFVNKGEELGVEAPYNKLMFKLIKAMEIS
ncbi:ketopantoate reductase family protein [Caldivirga sp.]|uniref:ketopantoate reductase family protein n=1 Tax=Caldivirga sp. TaxID=2080243 RepID=UPI0025C59E77|nr:ketopantoate reductase family protein [Caldivirga sp.]